MKVFNVVVLLEVLPGDTEFARIYDYDVAPNKKELDIFLVENELLDSSLGPLELSHIDGVLKGIETVNQPILFNDDHISVWGTNKELMIDTIIDWFDDHQEFLRVVQTQTIIEQLSLLKG